MIVHVRAYDSARACMCMRACASVGMDKTARESLNPLPLSITSQPHHLSTSSEHLQTRFATQPTPKKQPPPSQQTPRQSSSCITGRVRVVAQPFSSAANGFNDDLAIDPQPRGVTT